MHIFLTGDISVGKTTIINRFVSHSGLSADGFATYWVSEGGNIRSLYISPYSPDPQHSERYFVVRDTGRRPLFSINMMNVFDVCGNKILLNSGRHDIIVMDEIGFLESASVSFQQSVMRHIAGNVPILGAIKPMRTEFLDTIRAHPNVEIREVTAENRDDVLTWVLGQMNAKCRKGETADEYI